MEEFLKINHIQREVWYDNKPNQEIQFWDQNKIATSQPTAMAQDPTIEKT